MTPARLHPYAAYKDSGIFWLGKIPAHWVVTRLKSFATVQLSNVDKKSTEGQDAVQLCNYVDVYYNERIDDRVDFMSATATSEQVRRFSLQSGDVLITKDSETWTDIAVPAVVSEDLPGVLCGYHLAHIRPGQHCNGGYLSRLIAAIGPRDQYHISANGITRFGLTGDSVRAGVFAIPPVPEQCAIAAFLDRETAKIDALVAKKERLIELLQEKRSALISQAVTKGLDPDVSMKDSGVEWMGGVPAHWEVKRLRMLANIATGGRDTVDQREDGQYPLFVRSQTVERIDTWSFDGEAILTAGDGVGVAKVFHYVNGKFDFHQRVYRFSNFRLVTGRFFFYYFMAMLRFEVLQGTAKSTVDSLRLPMLQNFPVVVFAPTEQISIVAYLDRETAKIDALVAKVREAIDRLTELRQALISAAVTGKIDVRDASAPVPEDASSVSSGPSG